MEPLFGFLSDMDIDYLKRQGSIQSTVTTTKPAFLNIVEPAKNGTENRNIEPSREPLQSGTPSPGDIPVCQRLLAALISEDENDDPTCSGNNDLKFNVYGSTFEFETDAFSGYGISSTTLRSCNELAHSLSDNNIMSIPDSDIATRSEYHYGNMSMNERLLLEIRSIGLYPELVPDLANTVDEDINGDISDLEKKHHEQVSRKKSLLDKLLKSATEAKELQEKELEQHSLDKLIGMAYRKYMSCWGPNAPKSASGKLAKQAALAFVKRTLDRCQEYESTGKSCFTESLFREMFASGTDVDSGQLYGNSTERVSGTQLSPSLNKHDEIWSNRVKKRELYLDDVVAGTSAGTPTRSPISNGAKGKRSERDREWKGNNGFKVGRPPTNNSKGERKTKTKLKQKTTQLSASVNGPLGRISDQHKPTLSSVPKPVEIKENDEYNSLELEPPLDFSHLQLPEMDVLGVGDDFGEQGQDIGSWLNIDDEGLQDDDFLGLEIPMDDLTDLNMMV